MEGGFSLADAITQIIPLFDAFWTLITTNVLGVAFIGLVAMGIGCSIFHKIKGC